MKANAPDAQLLRAKVILPAIGHGTLSRTCPMTALAFALQHSLTLVLAGHSGHMAPLEDPQIGVDSGLAHRPVGG
ncbi:MAG: hypothetical protein VB089_09205 [Anaerolineaceae bacterium]|nr:hypothetical protein [Anaerolineaceae bacterium]